MSIQQRISLVHGRMPPPDWRFFPDCGQHEDVQDHIDCCWYPADQPERPLDDHAVFCGCLRCDRAFAMLGLPLPPGTLPRLHESVHTARR